MGNFVLDFLENQIPTAGGVLGGFAGEAIDPLGGGIVGSSLGTGLGKALENKLQGKNVTSGVLGAAGGGALGAGIGKFVEGAIPALGELGANSGILGKVAGGAARGAVLGSAVGGVTNVAAGATTKGGPSLAMDFLQGAGQGSITGALTGTAFGAVRETFKARTPHDQNGYIGGSNATGFNQLQLDDKTFKGNFDSAPSFMNAPGETAPTHVAKLDAMTTLQEDLNNGVPVNEALSKYMDTTGGGLKDAEQAYRAVTTNTSSLNKGNINSTLNPEFERASKLTNDVQAGDKDQAVINPKVVHNELNRLATAAANDGAKLSPDDVKLISNAHGQTLDQVLPQAEDKQAFTDAWNSLKKYDDTKQGIAAGNLNVEVPYRQNHLMSMQWEQTPQEVNAASRQLASISKTPGYAGPRTIESYQVGETLGLTRKNDNVYQDLKDDLQQSQSHLSQLALEKGLNQAYPGKVAVGVQPQDASGTWKSLQIPYGQKIFMPADLADELNRRALPPDARGLWKGYDNFNSNWKNLKLSGGGFHSLNTMANWFGQQLASGSLFKHPEDSAHMFRSLFDKGFTDNLIRQWNNSGQTLLEDRAGLNANISGAEGDIKASGIVAKVPILKQMHEAVFSRQIPMMMKMEFHQNIEGLDPSSPEDQAKMVDIAKSINQRYGAFNRDIQGVTANTAKLASRVGLAWGWNEGQIRTLIDAASKGGIEGKLARQTVFGKALLFGALATAGGAAGGEFKNQTPKQVALDILQKAVNPSFKFGNYTVGLPTTQLSEVGKPIAQTATALANGTNAKTPSEDFLISRLAAIPSAGVQALSNRTFGGQTIAGKDYYGRPISPGQTGANIASMFAPIPAAQGVKTYGGQESPVAMAANIAGLNATPTYTAEKAKLAGQTHLAQMQQTPGITPVQIDAATQFFDLLAKGSKNKNAAIKQAETDIQKKDPQAAQAVVDKFNQKLIQTLQPWAQSGQAKTYLDSYMIQQLQASKIKMDAANKQLAYDINNNPTAVGAQITALKR